MSKVYVHGYDPREALRLQDQATREVLGADQGDSPGEALASAQ